MCALVRNGSFHAGRTCYNNHRYKQSAMAESQLVREDGTDEEGPAAERAARTGEASLRPGAKAPAFGDLFVYSLLFIPAAHCVWPHCGYT